MSKQSVEDSPNLEVGLDPTVRDILDRFVREGTVFQDFIPTGSGPREQIASIRLEATRNWYKKNDPEPATEEQMARFLAALAEYETVHGGQITVHGWLMDWKKRELEYRFRCDKCRQHYDEVVEYYGQHLCLWCWHRKTKQPIPQAKRPPGHNIRSPTYGPHNTTEGVSSTLLT